MKLVFSRKGFDSGAGGAPSPIVAGRPVSLPIPTTHRSATSYGDLGLGSLVERATGGRIGADHLCHHDPMMIGERCLFGQCGAAQSHLRNQGVGLGDVFLFFGLFATADGDRHHRLFGYLRVDSAGEPHRIAAGYDLPRPHPHTLGEWNGNNTLYAGEGRMAATAPPRLRLTRPGGPVRQWRVPPWLRRAGLSFHGRAGCWIDDDGLEVVARGQEFVADIGDDPAAHAWVAEMVEAIRA